MMEVTSVSLMRRSDAATIQKGISGRELMYRAGEAIYNCFPWQGKTAIVCGSGNNAGDGYVLASLLKEKDIPCTIILLSNRFSEDGKYFFDRCMKMGVECVPYTIDFDFSSYLEIADCIFGTGFSGEVQGIYADAIRAINAASATVISIDINSGLNGDNGQGELAVNSDLTLSIGSYQYGHFLGKAKDLIGSMKNLDIGIELIEKTAFLTERADLAEILAPRKHASHKGNYGYVAIVGGCKNYSGAVKLANISCSALRSGCGVSTLVVPSSIVDSVSPYLLESTVVGIPDENGYMLPDFDALDAALSHRAALAIGMGWGSGAHHADILKHILEQYEIPVVIDADGLNTLAKMERSVLRESNCPILLTPHVKEFSRLSGYSIAEITASPVPLAEQYARENGVFVLLKGSCTVITDGERTLLCNRGCPGMATAGSGDVLSGILVGLLGYNSMSVQTAACGAYIAGLAGELAEKELNSISMLASDTVAHIPQAISQITKGAQT